MLPLRKLVASRGPFASVYLDGSRDTEDAAKEIDLRWRSARKQLADQGAGEPTLTALDEAIQADTPVPGRAGRILVAAGDRVLADEHVPHAPPVPVARVSTLPYLVPLVTAGPPRVPHVVVAVDKIGADLRAVDGDGTVVADYTVAGHDHPVHTVRGGGWSHRNIQAHTAATVTHNVDQVAGEVAALVERVRARLLVLAGDVDPRGQLRRALPESCVSMAVEVETARRTAAANRTAFDRDVRELVAEQWRAERGARLDRLRAELGRAGGKAVQGLRDTAAALREANVELLVIGDPGLGDRSVWTGSQPQLVALDRSELDAMGAGEGAENRADEALPAAAIAVGAEVTGTEELDEAVPLTDGIGALLRH